MKFTPIFSMVCLIVVLALWVAGHAGWVNFALVLATVVDLLGSAIHGKKGNDTER